MKIKVLQSNIDKLQLKPCEKCNGFDEWGVGESDECEDHWSRLDPREYTHFSIRGKWYVLPQRFVAPLLSLIEVDSALQIQGAMYKPAPTRIGNLTNLLALLRKSGISDEQLQKVFPPEQIKRMSGRVLRKLVKGR